jgi:hypothetical protein
MRFNLRSVLIATAWCSLLCAGAGILARSGLMPPNAAIYLLAVTLGALGGTVYGAVRGCGEHSRWIRAFFAAEVVGTATGAILLSSTSFVPPAGLWMMAAIVTTLPAFWMAVLTDLLRQLLERYGGAAEID